jgi:hypothetical protein
MAQKSTRNSGVIILTWNIEPIAKKHRAETVVAFDTSTISACLLENLLDRYGLQMQNTRWQTNSASANIAKFDIFVLMERKWVSEIPPSAWTIKAVVSAKDSTTSARSNNLRRLSGGCCLSVTMVLQKRSWLGEKAWKKCGAGPFPDCA